MKKLASVLFVICIIIGLASCEKKEKISIKDFEFQAVDFVQAFNAACPETLEGIGTLDVSDEVDESTNYAQHLFDDYTSVVLFTHPETNNVQRAILLLTPDGMSAESSAYKFGSYSKIMISLFCRDEEELNKAIEDLSLENPPSYGYQNTFENEKIIIYFSNDNMGLRILAMPVSEKYTGDDIAPKGNGMFTESSSVSSEE